MAKRQRMNPKRDKHVLAHTAVIGKKINVNPRVGRGGIRF